MRVLLVTSDREQCGIRSYGEMMMEYMRQVAPAVQITEYPHPSYHYLKVDGSVSPTNYDIVVINHHAALHASWRGEQVAELQARGFKVVVIAHDTFETFQIMQVRGFPDFRGADALVVHEPVVGLTQGIPGDPVYGYPSPRIHYLRQGVPTQEGLPSCKNSPPRAGTVGFPFPFKNIETLCRATAAAGWGIRIIAPGCTLKQCEEWVKLNPDTDIVTTYMPRREVVYFLAECEANIFHSVSGNSGTTGPIRLAIAAGRPIISTSLAVNRQIRDLSEANDAIIWANTEEDLTHWLKTLAQEPVTHAAYMAGVRDLAEEDSWHNLARAYKRIYEGVLR